MISCPKIIAITGGIGAGKSVVSRILTVAGFPVYDCDSRAKALMNTSIGIRDSLTARFGAGVYNGDGTLNRPRLGEIIFADPQALHDVNAIVHPAVKDDLLRWAREAGTETVFVETAILNQSGLDRLVNEVWQVIAPQETRVDRVMARSALTRNQVEERIRSQQSESHSSKSLTTRIIVNDGATPLLPQIHSLLNPLEA